MAEFNALQDTAFQDIIDSLESLKTQVEAWRDKAEEWAEAAEDVEVESGQFSSLHHSLKADASRIAAELAKVAAQAAQTAAETAESNAETAQTAAEAAQTAAELAQSIVESEASDAETARIAAEAAQSAAEAAQSAAETARTGAETAEANAQGHEAKSAEWAENPEDAEVETDHYSSLHHASKSDASRVAAEAARDLAETYRDQASDSANLAESYANYEGIWSSLSGPLNIPASVFHNDTFWMLLVDVADVTTSEPGSGNTDWAAIGATVTSVNGKTGVVVIEIADISGLQADLESKSDDGHTHAESDITDLDKYTQAEADAFLAGKSDDGHTHTESDITDLDKYTQAEADALLAGKADNGHTHTESEITDLDKYTQAQVDAALANKANASDLTDHENDTDDPHGTKKVEWTDHDSNFTFNLASDGEEVVNTSGTNINATIPTGLDESVAFRQGGAGTVSLVEDTGVTISGDTATGGQGEILILYPTETADTYQAKLIKP